MELFVLTCVKYNTKCMIGEVRLMIEEWVIETLDIAWYNSHTNYRVLN